MNSERDNFNFRPKEVAREVFFSLKDLSVTELGRYRESVRSLRRETQDRKDLAYYRSLEARINLRLREFQLLAFGETESGEGLRGVAKLYRQTKGMSFEKEALARLEEELDKKLGVEVPQIEKRVEQKVERQGFNFGRVRQVAATALAPLVVFAGVHLAGILERKYSSQSPTISRPALAIEIDNNIEKAQVIYEAPKPLVEVEEEEEVKNLDVSKDSVEIEEAEVIERLDIPDGSMVEITFPTIGVGSLTVEAKLMSEFPNDLYCLGLGGDNNLRLLALHNGDLYTNGGVRPLPGKFLEKFGTNPGATMFLKVDDGETRELVAIDEFVIRDESFTSDPEKILRAAEKNGVDVQEGDVVFITCYDYDPQTYSYKAKLIIIYRLANNLGLHLAKR